MRQHAKDMQAKYNSQLALLEQLRRENQALLEQIHSMQSGQDELDRLAAEAAEAARLNALLEKNKAAMGILVRALKRLRNLAAVESLAGLNNDRRML